MAKNVAAREDQIRAIVNWVNRKRMAICYEEALMLGQALKAANQAFYYSQYHNRIKTQIQLERVCGSIKRFLQGVWARPYLGVANESVVLLDSIIENRDQKIALKQIVLKSISNSLVKVLSPPVKHHVF